MMDYFASMFIDNELNIDEKITFLQEIRTNSLFYNETLELLQQEQILRAIPALPQLPAKAVFVPDWKKRLKKFFAPVIYTGAGLAAASLIYLLQLPSPTDKMHVNRFIIYEPSANQVELTGTFTGWQRKPMKQLGSTGYWELRLNIPSGEHRFSYILDGSKQKADPTLPVKEKDDFGGENSILKMEVQA
ncbi:MAG: glycogen-binding domain-containing protein [Desulforhopalus sp.]